MKIKTKVFGEIEIEESKMFTFQNGIIGFPNLKDFYLIYDEENDNNGGIQWLQSVQEAEFALPVMNPLDIVETYNPTVEDDLLEPLGDFEEEMLVMVTVTVPKDLTKMCINLMAPVIINGKTRRATQIIVQNSEYPIKYPIYDILQARKKG